MLTSFRLNTFRLLCVALVAVGLVAPAVAELNPEEQQIANLLRNSPTQGRPSITIDPILSNVARARARDMAVRGYFSHTNPDGHGPNYLVRQAGYSLPSFYDQSAAGNNIESIAAGYSSSADAWEGWMKSAAHKRHLLAEISFYADQTSVGVGFYHDATSPHQHYWVVLSAPPTGPTLAITSPAVDARVMVPQVTVSGTTAGLPAAARVVVQLENGAGSGGFREATGTRNWTISVANLGPGRNTIRVRSLDAGGEVLKESTRVFRYAVLEPLLVEVTGSGSVTKGFLGTSQRELGLSYTVTAKPAAGWLFERWSGGVESTSAALRFTMEEDLALTAHFRRNPFYARRGTYNGLLQDESARTITSGFFKASTTVTGAFSGRIMLGGKTHAFSGKFDAAGSAQVVVKRGAKLPSLVLTLLLDLEGGTDRITGTVTDGTFTAALSADQALPAGSEHFAAGRYTVRLPATVTDAPAAIPPGDGHGLLSVSITGVARLAGTLADGRTFSHTATVSKASRLPIYVPLPARGGFVAGEVLVSGDGATLEGSLRWTNPERLTARAYPVAFDTMLGVVGARYTVPSASATVLTVTPGAANSVLRLRHGALGEDVDQPATLLMNNRLVFSAPVLPKLAVSFAAGTGRFTGTFTHPVTKAASRISGVILQNENAARGFFLGGSEAGAVSFVPVP